MVEVNRLDLILIFAQVYRQTTQGKDAEFRADVGK
jgi:hypothetical protein